MGLPYTEVNILDNELARDTHWASDAIEIALRLRVSGYDAVILL
jgi:hypothetical protein